MSHCNAVTFYREDDAQILQASEEARESFRHFFNCVSQDFNRIVPACELECVKVPFCDDFSDPDADVEHMWVEQVDFDGVNVTGVLLNSPDNLQSACEGDEVEFPLAQLGDWLCVIDDVVYGGFTVQVIRSRMGDEERRQHDEAWELNFPATDTVNVPKPCDEFEKMIAGVVTNQIADDPTSVDQLFDGGRTLLHLASLFGRTPSVKVLLENNASRDAKCDRGWTAFDYAKSLGWDEVMKLLKHSST